MTRLWTVGPATRKIPLTELLVALSIGIAGFFLNTFELNLGWGMQFIFGNAFVYAFIRVLAPQSLVLAVSVSSIWSIILWHHPLAWIVWVCEAAFVALFARRGSPIRSVVIYWIVAGAPLLFLFYGGILKLEQLSLALAVAKQIANGILNVVLGEIFYAVILTGNPFGKFGHWPKVKIEGFLLMLLVGTALIPMTAYIALDAPSRERATMDDVDANLESRINLADAKLSSWVNSRSMLLRDYADNRQLRDGQADGVLPQEFLADFQKVTVLAPEQSLEAFALAEGASVTGATKAKGELPRQGDARARLVAFNPRNVRSNPNFVLIVPYNRNGRAGYIVASLRSTTLPNLVEIPGAHFIESFLLVSAAQGSFALKHVPAHTHRLINSISPQQQNIASTQPVLLSDGEYGRGSMADFLNSHVMRAGPVSALPEWQVEAVLALQPAMLKAREGQLIQFGALVTVGLVMTLIALFMSKRVSNTLGRVSQSAEDLARFGGLVATGDWIVIEEVDRISEKVAAANETFGRERESLVIYQRRLSSIAEHAPVIVYAVEVVNGAGTNVIYRSPSVQKILGYTIDETLAATWWRDAVHPEDYEGSVARFSNMEPGNVYTAEYRIRHKDGQYIWVYDTLSVETNFEAGETEAVGLIMDISERKSAADQLLQADKMASLGRMISGTAHELNQPLNFIKMATSNLRENAVRGRLEAEKLIPKLENVLAQVERASAILLQMRIFGRTTKEAPYAIDVKDTVEAVIQMAEPQMELDGMQVLTEVKASDVHVRALPVMLEQVLLNLLINANDAIRSRRDEGDRAEGEIKVTIDRNERSAVITVADNGPGIAADVLPKIFEPFFTTKPPKEGTGLGLSISYGIIRDMGGMLRVKSSRNGARFVIELPLAEATVAELV